MSFYTHYPNRKDRRRPYHDSRAVDPHCKNHSLCAYCRGNRTYCDRKRRQAAEEQVREWLMVNQTKEKK